MSAEVVFLGIIALAMTAVAVGQLVLAATAAKAAQRTAETVEALRRDLGPIIEKAGKIADDAARISALAAEQMERFDQLAKTTAARVDETLGGLQRAIVEPLKEGGALLAVLQSVIAMFRARREPRARDDEDGLFIG